MLAVLLAAPFLAQVDAAIANVATPAIRTGLGASGAEAELVVGSYLIAYAVLLITGARLGQSHGTRRLFLTGLAGFAAASLACGLAPGPIPLIIARAVQGGAAALMFPQALTGIQLHVPAAARPRAIGRYAMALSSGAVTGQLAGGALISANLAGLSWRPIFLINVPVCAVVLAAAARWLPADEPRAARRLDVPGVTALCAAALLLVVPLVLGRAAGWPAWAWACLAASVPATAVFVAVERRVAARGGAPLVHLAVLARPAVAWPLAAMMASTATYYVLLFTMAQYLQAGLGRSALASGLTLLPWVAAFGLAGQVAGRAPARTRAALAALGCLLLAATYLGVAVAARGPLGTAPLAVALAGGGFGLGLQFSSLTSALTGAVPAGYAADISGVASTALVVSGTIAVAGLGTLYLALDAQPGATAATHAFAVIAAVLAAVALAAAGAAALAARRARPAQRGPGQAASR
jgi:MFS family permease